MIQFGGLSLGLPWVLGRSPGVKASSGLLGQRGLHCPDWSSDVSEILGHSESSLPNRSGNGVKTGPTSHRVPWRGHLAGALTRPLATVHMETWTCHLVTWECGLLPGAPNEGQRGRQGGVGTDKGRQSSCLPSSHCPTLALVGLQLSCLCVLRGMDRAAASGVDLSLSYPSRGGGAGEDSKDSLASRLCPRYRMGHRIGKQ